MSGVDRWMGGVGERGGGEAKEREREESWTSRLGLDTTITLMQILCRW